MLPVSPIFIDLADQVFGPLALKGALIVIWFDGFYLLESHFRIYILDRLAAKELGERDRNYRHGTSGRRSRFVAMSSPETVAHVVILVLAVLGIFISLAGIAFWWASRKMNRLT